MLEYSMNASVTSSPSTTHPVVRRLDAEETAAVTAERRLLTERLLAYVPGPRALWIAVWALVPWLNAGANLLLDTGTRGPMWEQSRALLFLNCAALSFAIAIAVWGTRRIARRLEAIHETTWSSLEGDRHEAFGEMSNVVGPLLASAVTAYAFGIGTLLAEGWVSGILKGVTWFILGIALWTFLWTYASLALGLDRLGRARLVAQAAPINPTLGLRPLGRVAFMGLWMVLAWLIPVVLTGLPGIVAVSIGAFVLAGALAAFFLSLLRLHRQMAEVKVEELTLARELYARAYEPVRADGTLGALERQRDVLAAADALEKRAQAIHEWPLDQGTVAWVIGITTSVIAVTIARLILTL
jgi:hypothetical protein